ncbi:MAG: NADH dehydrogenase FAD-containing subunit [Spartobacteria bacterium]|nr:NADH dehydrogenase FAD-containing subunit [Spartobacteria bacterium]
MLLTLLLFPLGAGLLCFCMASDTYRRWLLVTAAFTQFLLVLRSCFHGTPVLCDGEWIGLDALAKLFLLITSGLFMAAAWYAAGYLAQESQVQDSQKDKWFSKQAVFTGLLLVFLSTMNLAIVSLHPGIFWMAVEATTLASAPLICYHRSERSLEAAWKYLLICSVGIALALIGNIALTISARFVVGDPSSTFAVLTQRASTLQPVWLKAAFAFLLVGYGTKMGLAPMHTWLPDAHSEAPSPVSALLSGALLNCAFLGLLRTSSILHQAGLESFTSHLFLFFGLFSMMLAGWFIVHQADYKRLLAYSSIEHMGIQAVAAGAGGGFGMLFHAVNHSLTKGLLFLAAGSILSAYGTKSTRDVKGLCRVMPVVGVLWIAGFLSICGVPPFGTFVSEFSIISQLAVSDKWISMGLMLLALGVIFVGMAKIVIFMVYGEPNPEIEVVRPTGFVRFFCTLPPVALCIMVLILGCWIPRPLEHLIKQAVTELSVPAMNPETIEGE